MSEESVLNAEAVKVIVFQHGDKEYALPVQEVKSIEKVQHITRVPGTAAFVKGVINLRGVVTPIIDLRTRFNLDEEEFTESTRMIIAFSNEEEVGLIVDAANDVLDIKKEWFGPQPEVVGTIEADFIQGIAKLDKRLLILLNLENILNPEDLKDNQGKS
ncbi:chemotaxis protein CheW [Peribacillus kribbensis]|uniref:chemotaxis protein CheW n=1 Tax=Peribacillus kribbensis TaxID=356658 RepID=UPI0003FA8FC3|nr:chemotaxis protein CheW [Peribacillus kribbensis]